MNKIDLCIFAIQVYKLSSKSSMSIEIRDCWLVSDSYHAVSLVLHLHSTNPLYVETHHVLLLHPSLLKVISLSYLPLSRKVSTKEARTAPSTYLLDLWSKDKTVSQNLREEGTRQKREASPSSSSKQLQLEQGLHDGADIGMQQSR